MCQTLQRETMVYSPPSGSPQSKRKDINTNQPQYFLASALRQINIHRWFAKMGKGPNPTWLSMNLRGKQNPGHLYSWVPCQGGYIFFPKATGNHPLKGFRQKICLGFFSKVIPVAEWEWMKLPSFFQLSQSYKYLFLVLTKMKISFLL